MNNLFRVMIVALSILIGMLFTAGYLPRVMPDWVGWLRPEWMLLVCFFWAVEIPERLGLVSVWLCGTLVDVLIGDSIGTNGACLALVSLIGWKLHARVRLYSPAQAFLLIFFLSLGVLCIKALIDNLVNDVSIAPTLIVQAISTGFLWIPISRVLGRVKMRFGIR